MRGRSRVGGVIGCCLVCERQLRRSVGGVQAVAEAMHPVLEGTPFRVGRMVMPPLRPVAATADAFDAAVAVAVAGEAIG